MFEVIKNNLNGGKIKMIWLETIVIICLIGICLILLGWILGMLKRINDKKEKDLESDDTMFGINKKIVGMSLVKMEKKIAKFKIKVDKMKIDNDKKILIMKDKYIATLKKIEPFMEWDLVYEEMTLKELDEALSQAIGILKVKVGVKTDLI